MTNVIAFSGHCADNTNKGDEQQGGAMLNKLYPRNQIMVAVLALLVALTTAAAAVEAEATHQLRPHRPPQRPQRRIHRPPPQRPPPWRPRQRRRPTPTPTATGTATSTPTASPTTSGTWSLTDYQYLYSYNAVYLSGRTIRYPNIPVRVGSTSIPTSVSTAFNVWRSASGGRLRFTFSSGSGTITVTMDDTMSSNICGQCVTWWNSAGEIIEAQDHAEPGSKPLLRRAVQDPDPRSWARHRILGP